MLYEVITNPFRKSYDDIHIFLAPIPDGREYTSSEDTIHFPNREQNKRPNGNKHPAWRQQTIQVQPRALTDYPTHRYRITSYNVCYTKLLRIKL